MKTYTDILLSKLTKAKAQVEQHELLSKIQANRSSLTENNKVELQNWMNTHPGVILNYIM